MGTVGDITKCSQQFPECNDPSVPNSAKVISRHQRNCWEQSVTVQANNKTRRRRRRLGGGAPGPRPGTLKAWKLKRRQEVTNAVEEVRVSGELAADAPAPLGDVHTEQFDVVE